MRYIKDSPLELGHRVWQLRPPQPSLTVFVKGTFDPAAGEPAPFAQEQVGPTGETYWDDDAQRSQRLPSDFGLLKPAGECFVVGKAWAPDGRPTTRLPCAFRIGAIEKTFAVYGDRTWNNVLLGSMSEPSPFTEMELSLERAYGGPGFAANPHGCGRGENDGARILPNLEATRALIQASSDAPAPLIVGPLSVMHAERARFAGTYDGRYMRERWPWLPDDLDWRFFLEAPVDQRLNEGYWQGNEAIELSNLHPNVPLIRSRLPEIVPRVFLDITRPGAEPSFEEIALNLDTITWDGEIGKLLLTWRGVIEIPSETLEEARHLFVAHDPLEGPARTAEELRARMEALLRAEDEEEAEAEGEEPPEDETDEEASEEEEPSEDEPSEDDLRAKLYAELAELGVEMPDEEPIAEPEAPPDPKALLAAMRESGVEVPPDLEEAMMSAETTEEPEPADEPGDEAEEPEGRALVVMLLDAGEKLSELDLTGADLSNLDLHEQDLSSSILIDANLSAANLAGANLIGASLIDSDLTDAVLRSAGLSGADLSGANLEGADLEGALLEDADFSHARMRSANLQRAHALRAVFAGADLRGAKLAHGDFSEADFERACLDDVDLTEAVLKDATLEDATAKGARFDRAIMTQCRGEGLLASEARFGSIDAEDSHWQRAELEKAHFSFAKLTRADFSDAKLVFAEMDGCTMREGRFERANAQGLRARQADLMEANFESADLSNADLRGANLFGAELWRARLESSQLELANLKRTKLEST